MTIVVQTASRLHFGVLRLGGEPSPGRHFGGVGLMVQAPGVRLYARPAQGWSADGPLAGRVLAFAEHYRRTLLARGAAVAAHHFVVESAGPEHAGLGTGTQLGLAVGRVLADGSGAEGPTAGELARRVGRGVRSGIGIHGFAQGGLLVEAGKVGNDTIAPLVARLPFPEAWRVVLVVPGRAAGLHGPAETAAFEQLASARARLPTEALCRLVLLGLLPAVAEHDFAAFGEALYEFNRLVGEAFRPVQGGLYAHPLAEEMVGFIRQQGVYGVGQSSWGPALFAITADPAHADELAGRIRQHFGLSAGEVLVTAAANRGAQVSLIGASQP